MASGKHIDLLINAANDLDSIYWYDPRHALKDKLFKKTFNSLDDLHKDLLAKIQTDSIILIMTNKNSSHIYQPIREYLEGKTNFYISLRYCSFSWLNTISSNI